MKKEKRKAGKAERDEIQRVGPRFGPIGDGKSTTTIGGHKRAVLRQVHWLSVCFRVDQTARGSIEAI